MKFYYLIKYYDVSLSSAENETIAENGCSITEDSSQVDTNFVYQIKGLIPVSEWELYVKPVVHPHGWIDMYIQDQIIPYAIIQKDNPVMVNEICYCDVLTTTQNTVLNNLCNIDQYGNVEMENFKYVYGCDVGTMNFGGLFNYEVFNGYSSGTKEAKIISRSVNGTIEDDLPKINPPIYSFNGYDGNNYAKLVKIHDDSNMFSDGSGGLTANLFTYYTYDISKFLIDFDIDPLNEYPASVFMMTSPIVNTTHDTVYIQSVVLDSGNTTVLSKSDIVSFNIHYSSTNPVNPNPVIPVPVPPSPK